MGALDAIRAKLAAQKAATTEPAASNGQATQPQASTSTEAELSGSVAPAGGSTAGVPEDRQEQPVPVQVAAADSSGPAPDPLAGLTGIQLLLARKKLAEQAAKGGLGASANRSSGSHSGAVLGTGSSLATQASQVQGMAQAVLTPAQRALEEAKRILQNKEGLGAYDIPPENADRLPQDLPAEVVSERLRELDAALVLRTPDLARLTIEINRNLRQYDELAYLLKDEQLGLIVQANLSIKNTELLQTKAKGTSVAKRNDKIAASLTADDI